MSESKRQSIIITGISMIVIGVVILAIILSSPKTLVSEPAATDATVTQAISQQEAVVVTYPLNLNTCTYEELVSVDGIGDSTANAILEYREYLGGYTSVEQLRDIKGIGDASYESLAPYFTL